MRIALIGVGKTGSRVGESAVTRGHEIVAQIRSGNAADVALLRPENCDVGIVFTPPSAAAAAVRVLLNAGLPVVVGTTGWDDERDEVVRLTGETAGRLLYAANFSVGVQVFLQTARELSRRMNSHPNFDAYIEERHHRRKADAPSGTAKVLAQVVVSELDRKSDFGVCGHALAPEVLSIASSRAGDIVGVHRLAFVSQYEEISLVHDARDRTCFADGAVFAAEWLVRQKPGVYTFSDCFA